MIESILPPRASVVDVRSDRTPDLFPVEERYISRAVLSRKREFGTGRRCAREALALLGVHPQPIEVGDHGQPLWPAGCVGSITHCRGYRGSAVARAEDLRAIGIDAEPNDPLPADLVSAIAQSSEIARLDRLVANRPAIHWDRLLFSAKESIYKALFPVTRNRLDFADAVVDIKPAGSFTAQLVPSLNLGEDLQIRGRWAAIDGLLLTSVVIQP